ncbi:MAG: beta-galactosidase [Myxococcales bacterium]|nr:beta-galactosidase [Myxococcales bacterium]
MTSDPPRVCVDPAGQGLRLGGAGGELLPLLAGAMHYFQLPSAVWPRCLDAICELGLEVVDTYVPWGVHERAAGDYDFESANGRFNLRLDAFLDACAERQLKVILRPGPHINAELTYFGFPERIIKDGRCLARGASGQPVIMPAPPRFFPVPSYASERFFEQAEHWLRAVAERVSSRRWPDGPIVAAQVDNELSLFFRTAAYDQDYHPDAVAAYRRWLVARYPDGLPAGYGAVAAVVETADPPRIFDAAGAEQLVPHLDWVAFKEHLVQGALARLGAALREGGLDGIPLTHNFPAGGHGESVGICCAERVVDVASVDLYLLKRDYGAARRAAERVAGSSRLPMLGELGWGGALWWAPQSLEDQLAAALTTLMHGVRALSFYMTVGRDRWYGAPIDERGRRDSARFEATQSLVAAVREAELWSLERDVDVALMEVRELRRLQRVTHLTGPTPPMVLDLFGLGPEELCSDDTFGFASAVQRDVARVERAVCDVLDELGVAFRRVDSDLAPSELACYRVLIVPSFELCDAALLERLASYVAGGGQLVLLPRVPERDMQMKPLETPIPEHVLIDDEDPSEALEELLERLGALPQLRAPEGVDVAHYRRDAESAIFVANRGETSRQVSLDGIELAGRWVWDAITGAPVNPKALHVEARQVRMLRSRPSNTGPVPRQPRPDAAKDAEKVTS